MAGVTIRDIARKANVGVGTVSRVLNNSPSVSADTRQSVLDAIRDLNYTPSPVAQRLASGQTRSVAVALPFLSYPAFVERLRGVQHALNHTAYQLVLYNVETPAQRDNLFEELTRPMRCDAVLVISIPLTETIANNILASNIPTVLADSFHPDMHCVLVDDFRGGIMAANHLLDLGHTRIAFLSDPLETALDFTSMKNRRQGYIHALQQRDIPPNPDYILEGGHDRQEAARMIDHLMGLESPPTAIFAASDTLAIAALGAAQNRISIPEEISIIGFDNIPEADYLDISTIAQPLYDTGITATRLLLSLLDQPGQTIEKTFMPLELLVRGTTAPPSSS